MKTIKILSNNLKNHTTLERVFFLSFLLYIILPVISIMFKVVFSVPLEYILLDVVFIFQVFLVFYLVGLLSRKYNKQYILERNTAFWLIILALWRGLAALQIGEGDTGNTPFFWNITLFFPELFEVLTVRASLLYAILLGVALVQIVAVFVYKPDRNN